VIWAVWRGAALAPGGRNVPGFHTTGHRQLAGRIRSRCGAIWEGCCDRAARSGDRSGCEHALTQVNPGHAAR